jgi:hypothetical protein
MNTANWIAIAGLFFAIGCWIHGRTFGAGRARQQMVDFASALATVKTDLATLQAQFGDCRLSSKEAITKATAVLAGLEKGQVDLKETESRHHAELRDHSASRDVHTDSEWRKTMIDRIETIAASIGKRFDGFEITICRRIESLETKIQEGGAWS